MGFCLTFPATIFISTSAQHSNLIPYMDIIDICPEIKPKVTDYSPVVQLIIILVDCLIYSPIASLLAKWRSQSTHVSHLLSLNIPKLYSLLTPHSTLTFQRLCLMRYFCLHIQCNHDSIYHFCLKYCIYNLSSFTLICTCNTESPNTTNQ